MPLRVVPGCGGSTSASCLGDLELNRAETQEGDVVAGGPIRSHSTETSEKAWAGARTETKLGDAPAKVLRKAYAWVDPEGDPDVKGSYSSSTTRSDAGGRWEPPTSRRARVA